VFRALIDSCTNQSPAADALLRKLCYGDGVPYVVGVDSDWLLHRGLASIVHTKESCMNEQCTSSNSSMASASVLNFSGVQGNWPRTEWLIIKSKMIRRSALMYIIKDTAIFPGTVIPVLPPNTLDVNLFLQTIFRHFNTDVIKNSYQYSYN
jgi:hypothetical protein